MPPQLLQLICFGVQQLIIHEPEIAADIKALFTKADPTPDDWHALHAKVLAKSYADYVASVAPAPALPDPIVTPAAGGPESAGQSQPGQSQPACCEHNAFGVCAGCVAQAQQRELQPTNPS